jgi:hypothetical protein
MASETRSSDHRPALRVLAAGLGLGAVMVPLAWVDIHQAPTLWLATAAGASAIYLFAMWLVIRRGPATRRELAACLLLAAVIRVPWLLSTPTLSDDIYRYIWDGRLQLAGHSPYVSAPADPALQSLHTPETRLTNQPKLPTIYPPTAQWFFRGVASIGQSVFAFKLAFVVCDLLTLVLLLVWLAREGRSPWLCLVYAWNPMVVMEAAGSGHIDALGTPLLFGAFVALTSGRGLLAAAAFVAAVGVKFLPVVLAPYFWARVRWRSLAVAAALGLAITLPFVVGTWTLPLGALPVYLAKWRVNAPVYFWLDRLVGGRWLSMLPAVSGLAVALAMRHRAASPAAWAWPLGASLICAPAVFPWYLLWTVPFLVDTATLPLLVWTQTVLLSYAVWPVFDAGGPFTVPAWAQAVQYGGLAITIAWSAARASQRRRG